MANRRKSGGRGSKQRRGKGEDFTGAKAGETEVRSPTIAQELALAKPEDILHHMRTIKGWKDKVTTLNGHISNAYKAAKTAKISRKTLEFLLGLERNDPVAYRIEMENVAIGLKAMGAPFQMNVFDAIYANDIDQVKAEASAAAKAGRGPECRFAEGSPAYDVYMETYALVQAGMVPGAENMTDAEKLAAINAGKQPAAQKELLQ